MSEDLGDEHHGASCLLTEFMDLPTATGKKALEKRKYN